MLVTSTGTICTGDERPRHRADGWTRGYLRRGRNPVARSHLSRAGGRTVAMQGAPCVPDPGRVPGEQSYLTSEAHIMLLP